jgi:esterase/lipase superfamily enzyme
VALDPHFKRVSDLAVFLFGQLFLPFSLQVLRFAAVVFRKQIRQKLLRFSWPSTKSQSLNWPLISETNPF